MSRFFARLASDIAAATAIEYAVVAAIVSLIAITALQSAGSTVTHLFVVTDDRVAGALRTMPVHGQPMAENPHPEIAHADNCADSWLPQFLKKC